MKTCDWIDPDRGAMYVICSNCNTQYRLSDWLKISEENGDGPNYCPHCGARSNLQPENK